MRYNLDYFRNFWDENEQFNEVRFEKWIRELNIKDVIITELKGNNREMKFQTNFPIILPYYKNLSVWIDSYNNNWYTVHTNSETLETDLANYRTTYPNYACIKSKSWLKNNNWTCISIRTKVNHCIGECMYFDNVCHYESCPYDLK